MFAAMLAGKGKMNRIYVGNLPYSVDQAQLKEIFSEAGTVTDTAIPVNEMKKPKGFAFVEFADQASMENAIKMFDGKEVGGRTLRVNEARPREERGPRPMDGGGESVSRPMAPKEDEDSVDLPSDSEDTTDEKMDEKEVTEEPVEETPASEE